jgi:hypothetical protein
VIEQQDAHLDAEIFGHLIKRIAMELSVRKSAATESTPSDQPTSDPSLPS